MLGVTPRGRRALAILASAWLIAAGVLGLRHEARVAHAIDAHGVAIHGAHAHGHRAGAADHLHAGGGAHLDDACALCAASHQSVARHAAPSLTATIAPIAIRSPRAPVAPVEAVARYRLAPKTSPPVA